MLGALESKSVMKHLSSRGMAILGKEQSGGVYALGGIISWVFLTWYVSSVDGRLPSAQEGMDTAEDKVGLLVPTSALPPSFNNTFVVSIDLEVDASAAG